MHLYEGIKHETNVFEKYDFPTEVLASNTDVCIFAEMCRNYPEAHLPESDPKSYDNVAQITDYAKRYNNLSSWQKMYLQGAMQMLLSRFLQYATPKVWTTDERMMKVLDYIHNHLYDDINIDSLADVACVTKPYLIRLFTQEFGLSPLRYTNNKRMEKSQLLLITSDMPIKDVAYTMGYNDHSYFIRLFKKLVGVTPQEYRQSMR